MTRQAERSVMIFRPELRLVFSHRYAFSERGEYRCVVPCASTVHAPFHRSNTHIGSQIQTGADSTIEGTFTLCWWREPCHCSSAFCALCGSDGLSGTLSPGWSALPFSPRRRHGQRQRACKDA